MDRILFFGDSICFGMGDEARYGWVGRLDTPTPQTHLYNLGIPGQTMAEIAARAPSEAKARLRPDLRVGIVLAGGLNDLSHQKDGTPRTPWDELTQTISNLISTLSKIAPLIVIGPPPLDEQLNPSIPGNYGKEIYFQNTFVKKAERFYHQTCQDQNIPFLPIFDDLSNDDVFSQSLADNDFIHPNSSGYVRMAKLINNWPAWQALARGEAPTVAK